MEVESMQEGNKQEENSNSITLSKADLESLYAPWKVSIIIKVFGKRLPCVYLKNKLMDLWRPTEPLNLIDLGNDYYVVKFNCLTNTNKVLHEGPWFIAGNFVSARKWESNFVPNSSIITHTTIWARLPQLPTEFYDRSVLERVGQKSGVLLKIDACTSATL